MAKKTSAEDILCIRDIFEKNGPYVLIREVAALTKEKADSQKAQGEDFTLFQEVSDELHIIADALDMFQQTEAD